MTQKPPDRAEMLDKLQDKPLEGKIELVWTAKLFDKDGNQTQMASSIVTVPVDSDIRWGKVGELVHRSFKYTADLVNLMINGEPIAQSRGKRGKK